MASKQALTAYLSNKNSSNLDNLITEATLRKIELKRLIATNNLQSLFQNLILDQNAAVLPTQAQMLFEKQLSLAGTLGISTTDYNLKQPEVEYFLYTPAKRYKLIFLQDPTGLSSGSKISLTGISLDSDIILETAEPSASATYRLTSAQTPATSYSGELKTLVLLVKFLDSTPQDEKISLSQAKELVFTGTRSVNSYYREVSFNKTNLTGDAYGYFRIDYNKFGCEDYYADFDRKGFEMWADAAEQKAREAGVAVDSYLYRMIILALNDCTFFGRAESVGDQLIYHVKGRLYLANEQMKLSTAAHELGHLLGFWHAAIYQCGNRAVDYPQNCYSGFGEQYDVMGIAGTNHVNAPHKIQAGWINSTAYVTRSGAYSVSKLSSNTGVQALIIPAAKFGLNYYLSYRPRNPVFDQDIPPTIANGVLLHVWDGQPSHTNLIDNTPATKSLESHDEAITFANPFYDDINNIQINYLSSNGDTAEVEVLFTSPTPTLTPYPGSVCQNQYSGKCVGLSLICAPDINYGRVDCRQGQKCVAETARCLTPAPTATATITPTPYRGQRCENQYAGRCVRNNYVCSPATNYGRVDCRITPAEKCVRETALCSSPTPRQPTPTRTRTPSPRPPTATSVPPSSVPPTDPPPSYTCVNNGNYCVAASIACDPEDTRNSGGTCPSGQVCCKDNPYPTNTPKPTATLAPGCKAYGIPCTSSSQCCSGLVCFAGVCQ